MKKFAAVFITLLFAACFLFGCGGKPTGNGSQQNSQSPVSADAIDANLKYFLGLTDAAGATVTEYGDMGDRTPTSESERNAAQKLFAHFSDKEIYSNIEVTELTDTTFSVKSGAETRTSQNVEIRFSNPQKEGNGQVIIGTAYDNPYGKYDSVYGGEPSTGAFTATGVATVMSVIDWVNANAETVRSQCDFDIVFVFFGCGSYNSMGATAYINDTMTDEQRKETLLMFNVDSLGGERTYLYADEVKTEHESFLRKVANNENLAFYSLPSNMPIIDGMYRNGVYYTHFAMLADSTSFVEWDIPSARIFSGYYGGFNLSDLEKKGKANLCGTSRDTYFNLKNEREAFAKQGRDAAALILSAVRADGFKEAAAASKSNVRNFAGWTNPLWAYIAVLFLAVAFGVTLVILVKHFEKKYPFKPIVKRMKIAVFGMDYETQTDEDVFVDIKRPRGPFEGY